MGKIYRQQYSLTTSVVDNNIKPQFSTGLLVRELFFSKRFIRDFEQKKLSSVKFFWWRLQVGKIHREFVTDIFVWYEWKRSDKASHSVGPLQCRKICVKNLRKPQSCHSSRGAYPSNTKNTSRTAGGFGRLQTREKARGMNQAASGFLKIHGDHAAPHASETTGTVRLRELEKEKHDVHVLKGHARGIIDVVPTKRS